MIFLWTAPPYPLRRYPLFNLRTYTGDCKAFVGAFRPNKNCETLREFF